MKKITKIEQQLREKLTKLKIHQNQFDGIIKLYLKHKDEIAAYDLGIWCKDINEGKRVRECIFSCSSEHRKSRGVYKITFDSNKFYIGRSKYIDTRIKQHQKEIDKFFSNGGKYPEDHYLKKVFEYLKENQLAYYFNVTLLEPCYTVDELTVKEQKWLTKYKNNPNCLNIGFVAHKPIHEIDETPEEQKERKTNTGVVRRGGRIFFYPKKQIETNVLDRRVESAAKSTPIQKQKATDFSFNVPEIESTLGHTVFRLYCGDRYIIHKGKTLAGSIFLLQKGCGYFLAYKHEKLSKFETDYYQKFYEFVKKNPDKPFKVEVVLTSDNAYEILTTEQLLLNEHLKKKKCLNNNLQSYIPTLNPKTNMHGWITPEQVQQFYSFLSSL